MKTKTLKTRKPSKDGWQFPTPGPWVYGYDTGYKTIVSQKGGFAVAEVIQAGNMDNDELEANARLIACAPEMLETLKALRHSESCNCSVCQMATCVINKALRN